MKHVIRITFDELFSPVLVFRESGCLGEIRIKPGDKVDLLLARERRCIGFVSKGEFKECPRKALVKGKKCASCNAVDEETPCLKCNGSICLAEEEKRLKCSEKNYFVYLAAFGGSMLKVGVSRKERRMRRWIEQGADFAVRIADGLDGRTARRIEYALTQRGFANALTGKQKISLLGSDKKRTREELIERLEALRDCFPEFAEKPAVIELSEYYPKLEHAKPTKALVGKSLGNKGSLLFLEQAGETRIFDLGMAVGRMVCEEKSLSAYL
ncbi:DUF2797 domain-containing protein [Candidatus Micrarchaeota archaeon]|nr:DUF2797 domain-containing protein [Candidatus Micrarchaeota archaeon]